MFKRKGTDYEEYLKEEIETLKQQLKAKHNGIDQKEVLAVLTIASRMREALEQCRQQSLPIQLAREIDDILMSASELD